MTPAASLRGEGPNREQAEKDREGDPGTVAVVRVHSLAWLGLTRAGTVSPPALRVVMKLEPRPLICFVQARQPASVRTSISRPCASAKSTLVLSSVAPWSSPPSTNSVCSLGAPPRNFMGRARAGDLGLHGTASSFPIPNSP
jgi:hypothetical protein